MVNQVTVIILKISKENTVLGLHYRSNAEYAVDRWIEMSGHVIILRIYSDLSTSVGFLSAAFNV